MEEQGPVMIEALSAFAERDYKQCCMLVATLLPRTTLIMIQLMLISLQRLGDKEMLGLFLEEHLHNLEKYPWEYALVNLTLGAADPAEVEKMISTDGQRAEFHCYLGCRWLTTGEVGRARAEFAKCLQLEGEYVEQSLAYVQMDWPAEAATELDPLERIGRLSRKLQRLREQGRTAESLEVAREAYELAARVLGEEDPVRLRMLNNLTIAELDMENVETAEALAREALRLHGRMGEEAARDIAITYSTLSRLQRGRGDLRGAVESLNRSIKVRTRESGRRTPEVATQLAHLADTLGESGEPELSTQYLREALGILVETAGDGAQLTETVRARLAEQLIERGAFAEAEPLCRECVEQAAKADGDRLNEVNPLIQLAYVLGHNGKLEGARGCYDRGLDIMEGAYGEDGPLFLSFLRSYAEFLISFEDFVTAKRVTARLVELRRRHAADRDEYAMSLWVQALVSYNLNEFRNAASAGQEILNVGGQHLPEQLRARASGMVGGSYYNLGEYAPALPHLRAHAARTAAEHGDTSEEHSLALHRLGVALYNLGKHEEAEGVFLKALKNVKALSGERSQNAGGVLNALGLVAQARRRIETAEHYLKESLSIDEELNGPDNLSPPIVQNLASILISRGDYEGAFKLLERTTESTRERYGESSTDYVNLLAVLGWACWATGQYEAAEGHLTKALELGPSAGHGQDFLRLKVLDLLFALRVATGKPELALSTAREAEAVRTRMLISTLKTANEEERLNFLDQLHIHTSGILSVVTTNLSRSPRAVRDAWQTVIQRKAISVDAMALQCAAANHAPDAELRRAGERLIESRQQLAALLMLGPKVKEDNSVDYQPYAIRRAELTSLVGQLEETIASALVGNEVASRVSRATAESVRAALPRNSSLVEFTKFPLFDYKGVKSGNLVSKGERYVAFVVTPEEREPIRLVDLGEAKRIDRLIARLRHVPTDAAEAEPSAGEGRQAEEKEPVDTEAAVGVEDDSVKDAPDPDADADPIMALSDLIVGPLMAEISEESECLFIVPDGEITRLSFAPLFGPSGLSLLDTHDLCYLNTSRDLVNSRRDQSVPTSPPVVVACPDYELVERSSSPAPSPADLTGSPDYAVPPEAEPAAWPSMVSRQADGFNRGGVQFGPLAGTRVEGEIVADILGVVPLLGAAAVKGQVWKVKSPKILHIATHGFFVEDSAIEMGRKAGFKFTIAAEHMIGGRLSIRLESPLLRSGLALAGANSWLRYETPPAEAGDGLLTAEDVAGMDLSGTELVVLSACDTGLGEVQVGEGVMGLSRSFMVAGANNLVLSLWKVPDLVTCILVERFYKNLLERAEPVHVALRNAQLYVRDLTVGDILSGQNLEASLKVFVANFFRDADGIDDAVRPFFHESCWGGFISLGYSGSARGVKV